MVYDLSAKNSYLKSENDESGRFWSIRRLFRDFLDLDGGQGLMSTPESVGGA